MVIVTLKVTKPVRFYLSVKEVYQHKPEAVPLCLGLSDYIVSPFSNSANSQIESNINILVNCF